MDISEAKSVEVVFSERTAQYVIEKIKISDHVYIHVRYKADPADSHMWHDKDCVTCQERINRALESAKKDRK